MEANRILKTVEEIKTFSDPYRLKIITAFRRLEHPATVKEVADFLDEVPAKVHYHVKKLEKVEILKLVDKKEINGIIAKYYTLTAESFVIQYSDHNKELNQLIINEAQRTFDLQYEESKQIVFNAIKQHENHTSIQYDDSEPEAKIFNQSVIYLSDEDIQELNTVLNRIKHKNKKIKNHKKYHLFSVLFPLLEDEED